MSKPNDLKYASFFLRIIAAIIDAVIFKMGFDLAGLTFGFEASNYFDSLWGFISALLYYALMESSSLQGSLGKVIIGIKIIHSYTHKKRIYFWRAIVRNLAKYIYILIVLILLQILVEWSDIYQFSNWLMTVRLLSILISLIGCIAPFCNPKQRTLYDLICGTYVVKKNV